jgi:uncharacterized protein YceK
MRRLLIAVVLALTAAGCGSTKHEAAKPGKYASFTANVTNPWYPLRPGSVYVYGGIKDGQPKRDLMTVTRATNVIDGARCVVVSDVLYIHGRVRERTTDWYTQDPKGNVWYFGEKTAELDAKGRVKSTSGSWQAGVNGAVPGIFMFAQPEQGRSARQEYYKGQAEDHFQVLKLGQPVTVPFRSFGAALLTKEWTPLEPRVLDHKYFVHGIGQVLGLAVTPPGDRTELVSFKQGS